MAVLFWHWLAQAPVAVNPSLFEQYGPGGALAAVLAGFCWVLFGRYEKTLDIERAEKKALQDELRELHKITRETTIPAIVKATEATTEALQALRKDRKS